MVTPLLFIGTTELLLIAGVALLMFGGKKLPEMMKGLGQGVREFKRGMKEEDEKKEEENDEKSQEGAEKKDGEGLEKEKKESDGQKQR